MAKSKLTLGVDIGSSSVKMVLLRETKRGYKLQSFGMALLPDEAIVDGALMSSSVVVEALQELLSAQRISHKEAATSVSGHSVIVKNIALPQMTQHELDESIQWEAEQYIPFDIQDVNIATHILHSTEATAAGQMDVVLVAAKKDLVNDYVGVIAEAGLQPMVVDVDAFAVQNACELSYGFDPEETVVLINAGASVTNLNIVSGGMTAFTRDITLGGNLFTEEIQKQLNVSFEEAEALKLGGRAGEDADSLVPQEVQRVIAQVSEQVAGEIQRSLDFYAASSQGGGYQRIYLSGGTAKVPSLARALEERAGVPVEILNPFKGIEVDERRFDPVYLAEVAPMAAVAVGLGMRRAGD